VQPSGIWSGGLDCDQLALRRFVGDGGAGSTSPSLDAHPIALYSQQRGTLPRSKPYRLEVSTPETSPNWTPALRDFREAGFSLSCHRWNAAAWTSVNSQGARGARPRRSFPPQATSGGFASTPPSLRWGNHVHRLMTTRSLRTGVGKVRIETGSGEGRSGLPV
jgi:hypothetical protein